MSKIPKKSGQSFPAHEGRLSAFVIKMMSSPEDCALWGDAIIVPADPSLSSLWRSGRESVAIPLEDLRTELRGHMLTGWDPILTSPAWRSVAARIASPLGHLRAELLGHVLTGELPSLSHAPNAVGGDDLGAGFVAVPVSVLDELIEKTEVQLLLLRQMRSNAGSAAADPETVELESPTGNVEYTLPITPDETYSSSAVSEILSPSGKGHRTIAQNRRQSNELLGIKIGNQFRYPKFQIDTEHRAIWPIVAYANRAMECSADPWGTLDWWFSEDEALNGRPVDMVATGELSERSVDFAIAAGQRGMD